jgi:hypothetical protein
VRSYINPVLPYPVADLLALWREQRRGDAELTMITLQQAGFGVNSAVQAA